MKLLHYGRCFFFHGKGERRVSQHQRWRRFLLQYWHIRASPFASWKRSTITTINNYLFIYFASFNLFWPHGNSLLKKPRDKSECGILISGGSRPSTQFQCNVNSVPSESLCFSSNQAGVESPNAQCTEPCHRESVWQVNSSLLFNPLKNRWTSTQQTQLDTNSHRAIVLVWSCLTGSRGWIPGHCCKSKWVPF